MIIHPVFSYPGVEAKQADASRVDHISNGVGAGAVQVLLEFSELDELPARQVVFKGAPAHKVVLTAVPLVYPRRSGCVCSGKKGTVPHLGRGSTEGGGFEEDLWRGTETTVRSLPTRTYVGQQWQIFPVQPTGASGAARRARC